MCAFCIYIIFQVFSNQCLCVKSKDHYIECGFFYIELSQVFILKNYIKFKVNQCVHDFCKYIIL